MSLRCVLDVVFYGISMLMTDVNIIIRSNHVYAHV